VGVALCQVTKLYQIETYSAAIRSGCRPDKE
jgi:hypothetical protein